MTQARRAPVCQPPLRAEFANDVKRILRGLGGIGAMTGNQVAVDVADELIRSVDRVLDIVSRHETGVREVVVDVDARRQPRPGPRPLPRDI